MRIGLGTRLGNISVFASKNFDGKNAYGCLTMFLKLCVLPIWLLYLYIRWCIKNNNECNDAPIYKRPWAIVTAILIAFVIVAGVWATLFTGDNTSTEKSESASVATHAQDVTPTFFKVDGYDMVQSLFLSLDGTGSTYNGFIQNVKGSKLEYIDRLISGGQCIEVWADKNSEEYTNKLEVTFYNAGEDGEYIRTAEYWYNSSAVRVNVHNEFESYESGEKTLCIIDARDKTGPTAKVENFNTIKDAVDAIISKG